MIDAKKAQIEKLVAVVGGQKDVLKELNEACSDVTGFPIERSEETYGNGQVVLSSIAVLKKQVQELKNELIRMKGFDEEREKAEGTLFDFAKSISCDNQYVMQRISTSRMTEKQKKGLLYKYEGKTIEQMRRERDIGKCVSCLKELFAKAKKRVEVMAMGEMIDEYKRCVNNGEKISGELETAIDTFGNMIKLCNCQEMIVMQQSIEGLYRSVQLLNQIIMNKGKMDDGSEINEGILESKEKKGCLPDEGYVDKEKGRSMKDYMKCEEVFGIVKRCCAHVKKREELMARLVSEYLVIRNLVELKVDRNVSDMKIGDHGEVFMKVSNVIEDGQKKLEEANCEIKKLKEVLDGIGNVVKVDVNEGGGKDFYERLKEKVEKLVRVVIKWRKENQEYEKQVEMLNGQLQEMKRKTGNIREVEVEYDNLSSRFGALTNRMVGYENQEKERIMKLRSEFTKNMYNGIVSLDDMSDLNVDSGIELLANAVGAVMKARNENAVKLRSMNRFFYSIVSAVDGKTEQSVSGSMIEKDACERVQKKVKLLARMNGELREWYIENNSKGVLNTVGEEDNLVCLIRECIERREDNLRREYRDVVAMNIEILNTKEDLEKQNGELIERMKKMNEMQEKLKKKLLKMKSHKVNINNIVEALKDAGKGEVREDNVTEVLREFVEGSNATAQEVESVKQALGVEENVDVVKVAQDKANELKELKERNDKVRSIFNAGGDVDIGDVARSMANKVEELEKQNDELRKKDEDVRNMLDCEEGADVRESAQAVKSELDSLRSDRGRLCEIFSVNDNGKINVVDEIRKKDDEKNKVIGDLGNRLIVIGASVGAESDGSDIENKVQEQGNRLNSLEKQNKNLTKTIENVGIAFGWNGDDIGKEIEDLKTKLDSVEVDNDTESSSSADDKNKEGLRAKIDALIERCKILQAQSEDAMNKNEALSNTVRQIAQEVGVNMDKNGDGNNVVNAVAQLKETVAEQEQQINYVNENIVRGLMDDKDSDIDEDRLRKVSKVVDDISKARDVIKSRNGAFSNWQETIDGLMNENEELSAENNVFNSIANDVDAKSAEELRKKVEGLKKTQEEIEKKLDGGNSSGNLVDDIASLKHELDELREQIEAAKSALGNTKGETESNWVDWVSDLKRNNENLIGQLNDVNNAVGGDSSKGISERMEELKRRIGELTGTNYGTLSEGIEGLGILYNDLNTAKESVFAQLNDAQNENRELQSKVDTIGSIIGANAEDDMQADVQNLIDDYNGAKDLLNSAGCAGNGSLQSCVSAIIKSRDDVENERNRLMAQVDAVASIVGSENVVEDAEKMKEALNKANEEVSNAKKALWVTGDDEEDLSDGINALKEQVNESGKRIETLESENEKWRQQDEKMCKDLGIGEDQNAGKEIEDIAVMLNGKGGSSLRDVVRGMIEENEALRIRNREAESELAAKNDDMNKLQRYLDGVKEVICSSSCSNEKVGEEVENLVEGLKLENQELQSRNEQLENDKEACVAKFNEVENDKNWIMEQFSKWGGTENWKENVENMRKKVEKFNEIEDIVNGWDDGFGSDSESEYDDILNDSPRSDLDKNPGNENDNITSNNDLSATSGDTGGSLGVNPGDENNDEILNTMNDSPSGNLIEKPEDESGNTTLNTALSITCDSLNINPGNNATASAMSGALSDDQSEKPNDKRSDEISDTASITGGRTSDDLPGNLGDSSGATSDVTVSAISDAPGGGLDVNPEGESNDGMSKNSDPSVGFGIKQGGGNNEGVGSEGVKDDGVGVPGGDPDSNLDGKVDNVGGDYGGKNEDRRDIVGKVKNMIEQLEKLKIENEEMRKDTEEKTVENGKLKVKNEELSKNVEIAFTKLSGLEKKLRDVYSKLCGLNGHNEKEHETVEEVLNEIDEVGRNINNLEQSNANLQADNEEHIRRYNTLQSSMQEWLIRILLVLREDWNVSDTELNKVGNEAQKLIDQCGERENMHSGDENLDDIVDAFKNMKQQSDNLVALVRWIAKNFPDNTDDGQLPTLVGQCCKDNGLLRQRNDELANENKQMQIVIDGMKDTVGDVSSGNEEVVDKTREVVRKGKEFSEKVADVGKSVKQKITLWKNNVESDKESIRRIVNEMTGFIGQCRKIVMTRLGDSVQEKEELKGQVASLNEESSRLQNENKAQGEQIARLKTDVADAQSKNQELQDKVDSAENAANKAKEENEKLQNKVRNAEDTAKKVDDKNKEVLKIVKEIKGVSGKVFEEEGKGIIYGFLDLWKNEKERLQNRVMNIVKRLKQEMGEQKELIATLQDRIREEGNGNKVLQNSVNNLTSELNNANEARNSADKENERLRKENELDKGRIVTLEKEVADGRDENNELTEKVREAESNLDAANAENEELKKKNDDNDELIEELKRQVKEGKKINKKLNNEYKELVDGMQKLRERIDALQKQYDALVEEKNGLQAIVDGLRGKGNKDEIDALKRRVSDIEKQMKKIEAEKRVLSAKNEKLEKNIAQKNNENEELQKACMASDEMNVKLQASVEGLKMLNGKVIQQNKDLKDEMMRLKDGLAAMNDKQDNRSMEEDRMLMYSDEEYWLRIRELIKQREENTKRAEKKDEKGKETENEKRNDKIVDASGRCDNWTRRLSKKRDDGEELNGKVLESAIRAVMNGKSAEAAK